MINNETSNIQQQQPSTIITSNSNTLNDNNTNNQIQTIPITTSPTTIVNISPREPISSSSCSSSSNRSNHHNTNNDTHNTNTHENYENVIIINNQKRKSNLLKILSSFPITVGEIITIIGWIIATGLCIWYIYDSSNQFILEQNTPTTATSFVESVPLYFPAITICNWNANIECDYCNLTLRFSTRVDPNEGTVNLFDIPYELSTILQNGQLFNCYVFNNETIVNNLLTANATGYAGTISFYFDVPNVPEDRDARFGLQVSFHEPGTIPKVFAETNFAISGVDNYFVLTKVVTEFLKPTVENPDLIDTRWDSLLSIVELTQTDDNLVVISVAYASLNENKITEIVTSSMEGLLGQIAGIIGIFMGLDVLKMLRGALEVPYAIKKKSIRGLWENFN